MSALVDTVNIMAYDADGLLFDYPTILDNFKRLGNVRRASDSPPSHV